jgi:hypothetical protein
MKKKFALMALLVGCDPAMPIAPRARHGRACQAIHAAPPLNKSAIGAGVAKAQKLTNAGVFVLCC